MGCRASKTASSQDKSASALCLAICVVCAGAGGACAQRCDFTAGAPLGWAANANRNALSLDCAKRSILQRKLTDQTGVTGHSQCLQFGK